MPPPLLLSTTQEYVSSSQTRGEAQLPQLPPQRLSPHALSVQDGIHPAESMQDLMVKRSQSKGDDATCYGRSGGLCTTRQAPCPVMVGHHGSCQCDECLQLIDDGVTNPPSGSGVTTPTGGRSVTTPPGGRSVITPRGTDFIIVPPASAQASPGEGSQQL